MWQHKQHAFPGFTAKYNVNRLLYYESFSFPEEVIQREKQLKGWRRLKKIALITKEKSKWVDLSDGWFDHIPLEFKDHNSPAR
jgi:putative endonuclease